MRRQSLLWGVLGGLLALQTGQAFAFSQRRPSAGPAYSQVFSSRNDQQNLSRVVFRNGLTVLIEDQPQSPLASVTTYLKSGYLGEVAQLRGGGRLLQRLHLHHSEAASEMLLLGAISRGEISGDATIFSSVGPADNVLEILRLHAALLEPVALDRDVLARERRILLEEERRRLALPRSFARQKLLEMVYPDHPASGGVDQIHGLGNALLESETVVERLEGLRASLYRARNTILVVCGAVNREEILETASRLYGSLQGGGGSSLPIRSSPWRLSAGVLLPVQPLAGHAKAPLSADGISGSGIRAGGLSPVLLLSYMLGKGRSAMLQGPLSGEEVAAVEVEARLEAGRSRGLLLITVIPELSRIDRAEVAVLVELERMRRRGVPIQQLNQAKALLLKDHYLQLQGLEGRSRLLARGEAAGDHTRRDRLPKRLAALTPEHLGSVLEKYFQPTNLALLEYFPEQAEPRSFTAASLQETLGLMVASEVEVGEDTLVPGVGQPAVPFQLPPFVGNYLEKELQRTSILRGPTVYFEEEHRLPLVHLGVFFPGGRVHESSANAGMTELLLRGLLRAGEKALTSDTGLSLEALGSEVRLVNQPDFFGFQLVTLSHHTREVLVHLLDQIHHAALEEEHLAHARGEVLALLDSRGEVAWNGLLEQARAAVFPDHPYGLPRYGTSESVRSVTLPKLRVWREGQIGKTHPVLIIRGDIEGTSFLRESISLLSDSTYQRRGATRVKLAATPGRPLHSVLDSGNGRAVMGFRGPGRERRELAILDVLESVLQGPGVNLAASLRASGLGYGLDIGRQVGLNGGGLFARLVTFGGREEEAVHQLLEELGRVREGRIRKKEFLASLVAAITRYHLLEERGDDYLLELARNLMAGVDVQILKRYRHALGRIDLGDITSVAKRYFPDPAPTPASETGKPEAD